MALKNVRHEIFCQTYVNDPSRFIRFNASRSYSKVYPNANPNTCSVNGARLKFRYRYRLIELWKQVLLRDGTQLTDYRRRVEKKFSPDSQRGSQKTDQTKPSSVTPTQAMMKEVSPKAYEIPKHRINNSEIDYSERDPWDDVVGK